MKKVYRGYPHQSKPIARFLLVCVLASGLAAVAEDSDFWFDSYDEGVAAAQAADKPVLLDFTAEWCVWCRKMEADVFSDPKVQAALEDFVCIRVDTEKDPRVALAYQVRSLPRFVVLNTFGEITVDRTGYMPVEVFLDALADGRAGAHVKLEANAAPEVKPIETSSQVVDRAIAEAVSDGEAVLLALLSDPDPGVREEALDRILANKEATVPVLIQGLSNPYLGTRIASVEALRGLGIDLAPYDPWATRSERERAASEWKGKWEQAPGKLSEQ
ncbi:MAG: thioredoxin family protein [Candidatus Hydrogenedentes bacterium]|nr:thioredoxin family protein [Candidatus Hydrogenedentota bacterium]